jgi:colanic acid biosynthesis glycosyl transferase WcaI
VKVLVLSINYAPELTGFSTHVASLCEHLAQRGHSVTVLTGFPFAPNWRRWPEYRGRFRSVEQLAGVRVIRHTHFIPRAARRMAQRLLMEGSFCLAASLSLTGLRPRPDVVLYVGAQPSIAMLCRLVAVWKGCPYVAFINDLAAGAAADVGIVKSAWLQKVLSAFEFAAYRGAETAVVLSERFKTALAEKGYPRGRVRVIRSPIDVGIIRPVKSDGEFRARHGISEGDFVVMFAGSMGLKQGMANVVEAARLLGETEPSVRWVLVGDGETRSELEESLRRGGLEDRVRLLPFQPEAAMAQMFAASDLLLLNQLSTVKDTVVPSKLLTYMSAGKPVLAAVNFGSEGAAILREAGGGRVVPPDDPAALAGAVAEMRRSVHLGQMGAVNRAYAEAHFDEREVLGELERTLLAASDGSRH